MLYVFTGRFGLSEIRKWWAFVGRKVVFNSYILEVKAFDKSTPKCLLSNKLKSTAVAGSQSKA